MKANSRAVCYSPNDYAGFWRRLAVELADLVAVMILLIVITVVVSPAIESDGRSDAVLLLCWVAVIYLYFVIMKRSRVSTLGYRLAHVRVVDAYGRPPSLGALTLRLLFAVFGPLNFAFDMLWIPSDRCKQSLRDKLAHTYVVKASAQPVGAGRVVYRQYHLMGMSFLFQEIEPSGPQHAS